MSINEKEKADSYIKVTTVIARILLVVCIIMAIVGVPIAAEFLSLIRQDHIHLAVNMRLPLLLVLGYGCAAAVIYMLIMILKLLKRLKDNQIFDQLNIHYLSIIADCCFLGTMLTFAIGMLYDWTFIVITVCACFMGMIVKVIGSLFRKAEAMKDELDLTI